MPGDQKSKASQASRGSAKKHKTKKKSKHGKRVSASTSPPRDKSQVLSVPIYPKTLPMGLQPHQSPIQSRVQLPKLKSGSKKDGERVTGKSRRSIKHLKYSSALLPATNKTSGHPVQGYTNGLTTQTRESLKWEGVLEDPEAEEKRLELYRAKRRQRFISQREALLGEIESSQTFPVQSKEQKSLSGSDHMSKA